MRKVFLDSLKRASLEMQSLLISLCQGRVVTWKAGRDKPYETKQATPKPQHGSSFTVHNRKMTFQEKSTIPETLAIKQAHTKNSSELTSV